MKTVSIKKNLATGTKVETYNYGDGVLESQVMAVWSQDGCLVPVFTAESAKTIDKGLINRVVINKTWLKEHGWTIIES